MNGREDQSGRIALNFVYTPGYLLEVLSVEQGNLGIRVKGGVDVSQSFRLEHSNNLESWAPWDEVYTLENGEITIQIMEDLLDENSFFRTIEF